MWLNTTISNFQYTWFSRANPQVTCSHLFFFLQIFLWRNNDATALGINATSSISFQSLSCGEKKRPPRPVRTQRCKFMLSLVFLHYYLILTENFVPNLGLCLMAHGVLQQLWSGLQCNRKWKDFSTRFISTDFWIRLEVNSGVPWQVQKTYLAFETRMKYRNILSEGQDKRQKQLKVTFSSKDI